MSANCDIARARILMVDDHPPNLIALDAILQPLGQELVRAHSGRDALRELLKGDFALILMDVQMPELDGLETARIIKERPRDRSVPIIFLTAIHKDPAYIFRGYREGAVDYLLKPVDPEILRSKVSVFVELWQKGELLRRQEALLRASEVIEVEKRGEMRYRALTDSMPQCVWAARTDGVVHFSNRVWREYAGEGAALDLFGSLHDDEREPMQQAWREAVRAGAPLEREVRLRRHDGAYRWHLCRVVPERERSGRLMGFICTATDIEANRRLLSSEKEARALAEVANRTKDEFLATVSHELRTPLNAILGWTRMLRTGAVAPPQQQRVLETIERNARVQTQLVDDILDVSRIIAGKLRVNPRRMDLHAVARAAMDAVRPAADLKGVQLTAELQESSQEFCGDPDRMQQVIWNLLANAVKFTPREGGVTLVVRRDRSMVEISVSDTGVGIPQAFLAHVFDRFWQADSSMTRAQGGLGLGLAIVRHLVDAHGGTVEAHSDGEGKGARFTVRLPMRAVAPAPDIQPLAAGGEASPPRLEGVEVVVVDDEADARDLVSAVLVRLGARVRLASSVQEAMAFVLEKRPDVLISDIGLPREDGYALLQQVRKVDESLPVAALTAYAGPDDHQRALEAGFRAHVTKPIDPVDLARLVESLARPAPLQAAAG